MPIRYKLDILEALKRAGYSSTRIRNEKLMGQATLQQLRHDELVSWKNIARICAILDCQLGDILEAVPLKMELSWGDATTLFGLLEDTKYKDSTIKEQRQPIQVIYQRIVGNTDCLMFTFKNESALLLYRQLTNSLPQGTPLRFEFPIDSTVDEVYDEIQHMRRTLGKEFAGEE